MSGRGMLAASAWLILAGPVPAGAAPDLGRAFEIGSVVVHPDHERAERFYFRPGELELARDRDGRPSLHFLQMRWTGSALYGNAGETGSFSTLTLQIRMEGPTAAALEFARRYVRRIAERSRIELRPLPLAESVVEIVYAPIDPDGNVSDEARALPDGFFEADGAEESRSSPAGFWRERNFTVALGEHDSQLLWKTLQEGQVLMSVSYAFRARGVVATAGRELRVTKLQDEHGVPAPDGELSEPEPGLDVPDDEVASLGGTGEEPSPFAAAVRQVGGGVVAVRVDAARWPELFQRVDFDEEAPPGYAALRVYCYDFRDALRPDLFYKKVEIEAEAVGGRRVPLVTKFTRTQADLYARTIRFPVAVYMDRPYRYRISSAGLDGSTEVGPWREQRSWARILDITTPGGTVGLAAEAAE